MARKAKKKIEPVVICSLDLYTKEQMEKEWGVTYLPTGVYKHVSVSFANRLPTWEELKEVKEKEFGDVCVFQLLPKQEKYINVHPYCLHLFEYVNKEMN